MNTAIIVLILGIGLPIFSFLTGLYYIKRNESADKKQKTVPDEKRAA